jgi:hypothetical protein
MSTTEGLKGIVPLVLVLFFEDMASRLDKVCLDGKVWFLVVSMYRFAAGMPMQLPMVFSCGGYFSMMKLHQRISGED